MPSRQRVNELVEYVQSGRVLEAIDRFYADDVAMQENQAIPVVGKAANRERERAFFTGITLHENRARSIVVDGDHAVINWLLEFTGADGKRYRIDQLALQTWKDDRIAHERFIYDTATIAAA
jgi:ketosteroid isomerase-like protein